MSSAGESPEVITLSLGIPLAAVNQDLGVVTTLTAAPPVVAPVVLIQSEKASAGSARDECQPPQSYTSEYAAMRPPELICILILLAFAPYPFPAQTTEQSPPAYSLSVTIQKVILTFPNA